MRYDPDHLNPIFYYPFGIKLGTGGGNRAKFSPATDIIMSSGSFVSGNVIDGKAIAAKIRSEIKEEVSAMESKPGLATVLVGSRRDSQTYIRMKIRACEECGIRSIHNILSAEASEAEILEVVAALNADPTVHGILVQLPLPGHVNEARVLAEVSLEKDVDASTRSTSGNWPCADVRRVSCRARRADALKFCAVAVCPSRESAPSFLDEAILSDYR